jgi:hypothetical protein
MTGAELFLFYLFCIFLFLFFWQVVMTGAALVCFAHVKWYLSPPGTSPTCARAPPLYVCMYVRTFVFIYILYLCVCVCVYVCVCIYAYIYICIYMYIYVYDIYNICAYSIYVYAEAADALSPSFTL